MKNPIVLDRDQTCYNCSHFRLCHGRHQMLETIHAWNGHFDRSKTGPATLIFAALASACVSFDYQPDPPASDDEPTAPVTLVVQVSLDDSQTVASNVGMAMRGFNATLHTHDMKKVS